MNELIYTVSPRGFRQPALQELQCPQGAVSAVSCIESIGEKVRQTAQGRFVASGGSQGYPMQVADQSDVHSGEWRCTGGLANKNAGNPPATARSSRREVSPIHRERCPHDSIPPLLVMVVTV